MKKLAGLAAAVLISIAAIGITAVSAEAQSAPVSPEGRFSIDGRFAQTDGRFK